MAANPTDPRKSTDVPGVRYDELKTYVMEPMEACTLAMKIYPQEQRYRYQYARAVQVEEPNKALKLQNELIRSNYPASYDNAGWLLIRTRNDYQSAIAYFKEGARRGDPDSMVSLADMIDRHYYVPETDPIATKFALLSWAAQHGHSGAQLAVEQERIKSQQLQIQQQTQQQQEQLMVQMFGAVFQGLSQYDPAALVRSQIAQIFPGLVVFNPPSEMTVGTPEKITVRIMRSGGEDEVKKGLQGRGVPQTAAIKAGYFMRARLFGDGFEITSHSDEGQVIGDKHFAEWLFEVLPLESGKKTLHLGIAIRFKLPNSDESTDLPVLAREIAVQVNRWWSMEHFAVAKCQWFLGGFGTVFIGIWGYFWKRWFDPKSWFDHKNGNQRPERSSPVKGRSRGGVARQPPLILASPYAAMRLHCLQTALPRLTRRPHFAICA